MTRARIMIVEDEGIVALDMQSSLERLGYDVPVVVSSGEEAIEEANKDPLDLVLMDIMLAGNLDGISAAEQIRSRFNVPVIYLTAYADDDTLQRASITEPYGYLLKPFEERELRTSIEIALYKHRVEEALRRRDAILGAVSFAAEQFLKAASWEGKIQAVLERLGRAANVSRVYIFENSTAEQGALLARERYEWLAPGIEPQTEILDLQDLLPIGGFARWAETLSRNQPIYGHVREFPASERQILAGQGIQSTVVVPILVEQAWWGFIGFDECLQEREWSTAEIDALKAAAGIVGAAIQRTWLHQEVEQRATEMSTLYEVSTAGMTSIRLDEILDRTVAALHKALAADSIAILLLEPQTNDLVVHVSTGFAGGTQLARRPSGVDIPGWVVQTGQPILLADAREDERYQACDPATIAALCVPLQTGQRIIGAVSLASQRRAAFGEDDLRLLSILAGHLAAVIENAHLVAGLETEVTARTAEIRAEKEKSETILRSVGDAICMTDGQMQVRYVNPAFTTLTGYAADEITGQSLDQLLAEAWSEPDRGSWQHTVTRGEGWQGELVLRRKDGLTYEAAAAMAPIADAEKRLAGYVFSHQDISRLKALERARSQFMANVSHELRTPASIVKLCAQQMRQDCRPEEPGRYLQMLEDQANRLIHLIQDILEMAELDSGQVITSWEPLSLSMLIRDAAVRYQDRAKEAGVTLSTKPVPSDLAVAEGDQIRLFQALGELVENALIFTPAGGQVTVETNTVEEEGQQWVTVAVHDSGPGISLAEQERIFDRLYRGSLAASGHIPGSGLGLSMAQEIMRAHGGRVTVESEPGKGSTFTLWLRAVA